MYLYIMPAPKVRRLTEAQKKRLREHSKTQTARHMRSMRMLMMRGLTFEEAHKRASLQK